MDHPVDDLAALMLYMGIVIGFPALICWLVIRKQRQWEKPPEE